VTAWGDTLRVEANRVGSLGVLYIDAGTGHPPNVRSDHVPVRRPVRGVTERLPGVRAGRFVELVGAEDGTDLTAWEAA
jgi:hypothetical protein